MNQIKKLRQEKGLSQERLASAAGLHQPQVSDLERGRRPASEVERTALAAVLGVEVADLFPALEVAPRRAGRVKAAR